MKQAIKRMIGYKEEKERRGEITEDKGGGG